MPSLNQSLIKRVITIAHQAGDEIMHYYQKNCVGVISKEDNSPLTQADLASNTVIKKELEKISSFPYVSEETLTELSQLKNSDTYWLVDPLDGTKEFIKQKDEFTVNIALIHKGISVLGVIYAPARNLTYAAYHQGGSFKYENNKPHLIQCSKQATLSQATLAISRSHLKEQDKQFIKQANIKNTMQLGSSLKYCKIAEGEADIAVRFSPLMSWDLAAADCIVREAGGHISNTQKTIYRFNWKYLNQPLNRGLVVSNMLLHPPTLSYLNSITTLRS